MLHKAAKNLKLVDHFKWLSQCVHIQEIWEHFRLLQKDCINGSEDVLHSCVICYSQCVFQSNKCRKCSEYQKNVQWDDSDRWVVHHISFKSLPGGVSI